MASKLDKWVNLATAVLPGVDDGVLREELKWTLDEFFQTSHVWYETLPSFTVAADTVSTNMTTQANKTGQAVCYIDQVFVAETPIPFVRDIGNVSDVNDVDDTFRFITTLAPDVIRWVPIPTTDTEDVVVKVIYYSTDYNNVLPDFVINQYKDIVLHGLYGRMLAQPSKPYTNLPQALMYQRMFRSGCLGLKDIAERGFNTSDRMWSFPTRTRGRV